MIGRASEPDEDDGPAGSPGGDWGFEFGKPGSFTKPRKGSELHRSQPLSAGLRLEPVGKQARRRIMRRRLSQPAKRRPVKPGIEIAQKCRGSELPGGPIQEKVPVLGSASLHVEGRGREELRKEFPPPNQQSGISVWEAEDSEVWDPARYILCVAEAVSLSPTGPVAEAEQQTPGKVQRRPGG